MVREQGAFLFTTGGPAPAEAVARARPPRSHHVGHRKRLRERAAISFATALSEPWRTALARAPGPAIAGADAARIVMPRASAGTLRIVNVEFPAPP